MVLAVEYDNSGRLTRVVKGTDSDILHRYRSTSVVVKCPREVYNLSTDLICSNYRVRTVHGAFVELEHA